MFSLWTLKKKCWYVYGEDEKVVTFLLLLNSKFKIVFLILYSVYVCVEGQEI